MKIKIYETMQKIFRKYRNNDDTIIDYETEKTIMKNDKEAILIDVRSPQEYSEGHLDKSINFPLYDLERDNKKIQDKKNNIIIIYCQSGSRSKKAIEILKKQGYLNLYEIQGGLDNIR